MAKFVFRNEDKILAEFYDPDVMVDYMDNINYLVSLGRVVIDYDDEQSESIVRFHAGSSMPANPVKTLPVICPTGKMHMMLMSLLNNSLHEVIRRDIA